MRGGTTQARFFACKNCGSPNPARDGVPDAFVICHACEAPTPGPSSKRSGRVLSHRSGETCPFFCEESKSSTHRLCSHTSVEAAALADSPPLPWAALVGVFVLSSLLAATIALLLQG